MKTILTLLLLTIAMIACNAPKQEIKPGTGNQALVKQYFEHFNSHDWTKMASMYSDTADFKDPSLGSGIVKQTRLQTQEKYIMLHSIFPDLHDQVITTYPSGDNHIVVEFISSGTGPDKVKFELPICTIFTIENGLITKDFTYFDNFEEDRSE
jgi:SnoaL-like domain